MYGRKKLDKINDSLFKNYTHIATDLLQLSSYFNSTIIPSYWGLCEDDHVGTLRKYFTLIFFCMCAPLFVFLLDWMFYKIFT